MPYYSFVMVCYNNWNLSKQSITTLLNSLNENNKYKGAELLIVNNGSTDETSLGIEEIKKEYASQVLEIKEVKLEENMGYAIGLNLGIAQCEGQIITILNNDLIFTPGWFDGLREVLEGDKSVGVAVPFLSYAATVQNVGGQFGSNDEIHNFAENFMNENQEKIIYAENIISACVTFRRNLLNLIGGFDYWFGMAMADDTDWSLRANISGLKIAVVGSSFVYHIGNATIAKMPEITAAAIDSNHPKFNRKWNLRSNDNLQGDFYSFREIIENNIYLRKKHYFPTKISEFNQFPGSLLEKDYNVTSMLFIADWTNKKSLWRDSLAKVMQDSRTGREIFFWIPPQYFNKDEVVKEVKKTLTFSNPQEIKFILRDIFPVDLLRFLKSFDVILSAKNDYVNRYITYLASEIGLKLS